MCGGTEGGQVWSHFYFCVFGIWEFGNLGIGYWGIRLQKITSFCFWLILILMCVWLINQRPFPLKHTHFIVLFLLGYGLFRGKERAPNHAFAVFFMPLFQPHTVSFHHSLDSNAASSSSFLFLFHYFLSYKHISSIMSSIHVYRVHTHAHQR